MAVGELLRLPDDEVVGVGGGVIVLVTDGLIDGEVDVDIDKLLESEGDVLLEVEVDGDIDDDVEALADGLGVTEWDGDRELLLEAVGEML